FPHAVRWAADIQVDLAIAEIRSNARSLGERGRIGATKLKRDRLLLRIETEQPRAVAMKHGAGRHHLGIEQRMAREQTVEEPEVAVRPFHHRRNRESSIHSSHGIVASTTAIL